MPSLDPYDAVLLLSFGGPDGPDDVLPFLENVTRGRGIPPERLREVATHYDAVGGRSPINEQNRALLRELRVELAGRGLDLPVAWGNRNWSPYVVDALRELHEGGARRVLVVTTSAYSSYSSCRQYREDLACGAAGPGRRGPGSGGRPGAGLLRPPGLRRARDGSGAAARWRSCPRTPGEDARLVFVTHSIPQAMAEQLRPGRQRVRRPAPRDRRPRSPAG